jgi:hypothetical protein
MSKHTGVPASLIDTTMHPAETSWGTSGLATAADMVWNGSVSLKRWLMTSSFRMKVNGPVPHMIDGDENVKEECIHCSEPLYTNDTTGILHG